MNHEQDKIVHFFEEGQRIWATSPDLAVSRRFFEMWERAHEPRPFRICDERVQLLGHQLDLVEDADRIGYFTWDAGEMCPVFVVEGPQVEHRFLLLFEDGAPCIHEKPVLLREDTELSFGERLEVMYDIVSYYRVLYPGRNVLDMTQSQYKLALQEIAQRHERQTTRVMHKLPAASVKRLLRKAVEDTATDELSNQLALPLDGSYAVTAVTDPRAGSAATDSDAAPGRCAVPPRTPWAITQELRFLAEAARLAATAEKAFVLTFARAEPLGPERDLVLPLAT